MCHLVEELDVVQPLVSHHLKVLREAGLVESERFRYWTYYRLRTETVADIAAHRWDASPSKRRPAANGDDRAAEPMTLTLGAQSHGRRRRHRASSSPSWSARGSSPSGSRRATSGCSCSRTPPPPAAGLVALILAFGSVSGAHFNPVVIARRPRLRRALNRRSSPPTSPRRSSAACVGAIIANLMFDLDAVNVSTTPATSSGAAGSARWSPPSGCSW